jgi:hypothetical protein
MNLVGNNGEIQFCVFTLHKILFQKFDQFNHLERPFKGLCIVIINKLEKWLDFFNQGKLRQHLCGQVGLMCNTITPNMKGPCFSFTYIEQKKFEPWNGITPFAPKQISFKAKSNFERPPYKRRNSMITFVKLSTWEPSRTCYNFKRIWRHFHLSTLKCKLPMMIISLQEIETNQTFCTTRLVDWNTNSCITLAMFQPIVLVQWFGRLCGRHFQEIK